MDAQTKTAWLAALRSGKYEQGQSYLKDENNLFCCLGVLANVKGCEWRVVDDENAFEPTIDRKVIAKSDDTLSYLDPDFFGLPYPKQIELAELNDSGKSFTEIADYIEREIAPLEHPNDPLT